MPWGDNTNANVKLGQSLQYKKNTGVVSSGGTLACILVCLFV